MRQTLRHWRATLCGALQMVDGTTLYEYVRGNPVKLVDPTGNSAAGEAKFISMYEHAASLPPKRREKFYKTQGQIALLSLPATAFLATGTVVGPAAALKLGLAGALFGGIADVGLQLAGQADANSKGEPVPDIDYRKAALSTWIGVGLVPLALSPAPVLCAAGAVGGGLVLNQAANAYQEGNYYTAVANSALALPPLTIAGSRSYGAYQRFTNASINQARAGRTQFSELEWLLLDETGGTPGGKGTLPSIVQDALRSLPDEAFVVRGGVATPKQIACGIGPHRDVPGLTGFSAQSRAGASIEELTATGGVGNGPFPHGQVSVTTVGKLRCIGCDIVPSPGGGANHVTVTPGPATPAQISDQFRPQPNPARSR